MALFANPLVWIAVAVTGAVLVFGVVRFLFCSRGSVESRLARELAETPVERPRPVPEDIAAKVFAKLVVELDSHGIDPSDEVSELLVAGAIEQHIDEYPMLDREDRAKVAAAVRRLLGTSVP